MAGVNARTKLIMNQALKEVTPEKNIIGVNEHKTHTENNDNERASENLENDDVFSTFDDSDADKNYVHDDTSSTDESFCDYENNSKKKRNKLQSDLVKETEQTVTNEHIMEDGSNLENINIETATTTDSQEENSEQHTNNNEEITKKKITKRLSLAEKLKRDKSRHPMRNKCEGKCKRDCVKLTEENRQDIWDKFWSLDYTSRRKWMSKHIKLVPVKRKLASAAHQRSESRTFSLPHRDFTEVSVCRLTFLNTLGYTNDSVITELVAAIKRAPCGAMVKECRGIKPKPKVNRELIRDHIESYHPCVSHYRRLNAPNVRYLPRELTVKEMHTDFNTKHPGVCKIEIYRQVLKQMNISLCAPKSDICEQCQILQIQLGSTTNEGEPTIEQDEDNNVQRDLNNHRLKAEKANREYRKDAELASAAENDDNSIRIYSMDLQKVMLLPVMPQVKSSFFISRLVVFNETFATLNKNSHKKSYCVVWHEALAGRKAEALTDSILRVISEERDVTNFTFWADNCTGQNKNWILFTALITEVNRPTGPYEIRIRYLTKGHTHMSADGIHGNIEKKIGRKRNIYDFQELIEVITTSRTNVYVLELNEFHLWKSEKRVTTKKDDTLKGFLLNPLVEVKFIKGSRCMKYKTDFDEEFREIDFLKKKHTVPHTPESVATRGIKAVKKQTILNELVPLMPLNRRQFWESLPDSEASLDLVRSEQILDT